MDTTHQPYEDLQRQRRHNRRLLTWCNLLGLATDRASFHVMEGTLGAEFDAYGSDWFLTVRFKDPMPWRRGNRHELATLYETDDRGVVRREVCRVWHLIPAVNGVVHTWRM